MGDVTTHARSARVVLVVVVLWAGLLVAAPAASALAPAPTVSPERPVAGQVFEVRGRSGTRGRRPVALQRRRADGSWRVVQQVRSTRRGRYTFRTSTHRRVVYRAVAPRARVGGRTLPAVRSRRRAVSPVQQTLRVSVGEGWQRGRAGTVRVEAAPAMAGRPVRLQRRRRDGTWATVGRATEDDAGRAALTWVPPRSGPTVLRVRLARWEGVPRRDSARRRVHVDPDHLPLVVAHRGGAGEAPENTMAAFRRAVGLGVNAVETDVQCTAGGGLVLVHDRTLRRTTDVEQVFPRRAGDPVRTFTSREIARLDAGSWRGTRWAGERVPHLTDLLDLVAGTDGVAVQVELKYPRACPGLEDAVVDTIRRSALADEIADRVRWTSFDTATLAELDRRAPEVPTLLVRGEVPDSTPPWLDGVNLRHSEIGPRLVAQYRAAGLQLGAWTIREPELLYRMADLGVDQISTDYPTTAVRAYG